MIRMTQEKIINAMWDELANLNGKTAAVLNGASILVRSLI